MLAVRLEATAVARTREARCFRNGSWRKCVVGESDAADEKAVDKHLQATIDKAGRIDISFNGVGVAAEKILGVAAKRMVTNKSGVIMTVSALPARTGSRLNGGYGSASAAKEALTRDLSAELAPHGIRVVNLRPHGMPETNTMEKIFDIKGKAMGMTWDQFQGFLANTTHPRRVMVLAEMANVVAFIASDKASGMTGTTVNLSMSSLDG